MIEDNGNRIQDFYYVIGQFRCNFVRILEEDTVNDKFIFVGFQEVGLDFSWVSYEELGWQEVKEG